MASAALTEVLFTPHANAVAMSPLRQQQFLKVQLTKLKAGGSTAQQVVEELQAVRGKLLAPLHLPGGGGSGAAVGVAAAMPRIRIAGDLCNLRTAKKNKESTPAGNGDEESVNLFAILAAIVPSSSSSSSSPSSSFSTNDAATTMTPTSSALSPAAPLQPGNNSFPWSGQVRSRQGFNPTGRSVVVGLASIENSHVMVAAPGLSWGHKDEAALAVAME
jgi:hypothetical protein